MTEREQLERAMAHMEAQRATLGDAVVDAALGSMRWQLAELEQAEQETAPAFTGERKLVTVMFADISGFTALAEMMMDPEPIRDLMNACFEQLAPIVEKYGGTVDKFIGDEIMALFGAPIAHENDPERALRAALEMRDALTEFNAERDTELSLHFGINTGLVIAGGIGTRGRQKYSVMGDTVNVASRLEDASEQGDILVGPNTYRPTASLFEFEPLEPVQVKGKAEPVPAYRLLAARAIPGKLQGIAGLESPLVGREAELRALQEAIERLRAGMGSIVTAVGEAGIGKSRLAAELRKQAPEDLQWVEGRCLSYGASIAYLLWVDVLRGLLGVTTESPPVAVRDALRERTERLEDVYPYLAQLMSLPLEADAKSSRGGSHAAKAIAHPRAWEPALLDQAGEGEKLKVGAFRAVETLIESTAQHRPLVIVCEDLQWADPTSIELLEQLLTLTDRAPLLFLCVFRPERERGCWRIKETVARLYPHRHTDLWLDPLSAAESETLVGNLLQLEDLSQKLKWRILGHAEGNPFYVEEIIRSLIDSGAIVQDELTGRWQATRDVTDIAIPDTVRGVLMARIDRLQEDAKRVLQLASVIGRIFPHRVLAAIAREERELNGHLLTLQREEMIRERARAPELEYIFKHQLTQEAAYNSLLKKEQRVFHRQVAEALERLFPDRIEEQVGLLAHHWEQAGETERAIAYLRRAGEQAAAHFANAEAVDYFSRALNLTPEDDLARRYALLLASEKVYDLQGARQAQRQRLAALEGLAEVLNDDRLRAEAALRRTHYAEVTGDYPAAIEAAQAAIRLAQACQDVSSEATGYLQWGRALWRQGEYEAARSQLGQALARSRAVKLHLIETDSLRNLGIISHHQGDYAGARAYFEQALHIHREMGDRRREGATLNNLGVISKKQGNSVEAKAHYEQALHIFREIGDRRHEGMTLGNLGIISRDLGDYAGARVYQEQALRIRRETGDKLGECIALSNLGQLSHHLGDDEAAREYSQRSLLIAQEIGTYRLQGYALTNLGHALAGLGRLAEAANAYRQAVALRRGSGQHHLAMESLAGLARVSLAQGDLTQPQAQVEEILSYLESNTLDGTDEPFRVYLTCYHALRANQHPRAQAILNTAHCLLQERAAEIRDEEMRRSFLENVAAHREILSEWAEENG